jgi:ribulose 1,5-bisphosphate synthetase/thiazole synthase
LALPAQYVSPALSFDIIVCEYQVSNMDYKAKRIAVVGSGLSGIATAKHLDAAGLEVVVLERSSKPGGIW